VIYANIFDREFQNRYKGFFDIVLSRGFIEHFDNPEEAINAHLFLLKPNGYLVVSIPNFKWMNHLFLQIFNRKLAPLHNFKIMDKDIFCTLFRQDQLTPLFCGYYGGFNFGIFHIQKGSWVRPVFHLCCKLQLFLNFIFHSLFKDRDVNNRLFSPQLLYLGIKKANE
jgi:SAM-dependent methyltransferase